MLRNYRPATGDRRPLTHEEITNPYDGFLQIVCQQHCFHAPAPDEEDIARSPDVGDAKIAEVKRAIDRYNQQRSHRIEKLHDALIAELRPAAGQAGRGGAVNTETPGSSIDRLSILSLRLYHMQEQLDRSRAPRPSTAKKSAPGWL